LPFDNQIAAPPALCPPPAVGLAFPNRFTTALKGATLKATPVVAWMHFASTLNIRCPIEWAAPEGTDGFFLRRPVHLQKEEEFDTTTIDGVLNQSVPNDGEGEGVFIVIGEDERIQLLDPPHVIPAPEGLEWIFARDGDEMVQQWDQGLFPL
jgi:hypothetical protein